ncbi:MAG: oligosaccharide flippase family protein [Pseudomonadota bacterium]
MEDIKRALAVTITARGWAAVLGLLAVPIYISQLGIEAYGVVGFFASLQVLVSFLDLGMGTTLVRELARAPGDKAGRAHARDLTRTFELAYVLVGTIVGGIIAISASVVAHKWINPVNLTPAEVSSALTLAAVALICQWPSTLYGSGLTGVHRQTTFGIATSILSTVRIMVTVLVIHVQPDVHSFFLAQIFAAVLQTLTLRYLLWQQLPLDGHWPKSSMTPLRNVFGFAGGMTAISLTSLVLTQADKIILSNTLSLRDFGVYVVASTLASSLYVVVGPLFQIFLPSLSRLVQSGGEEEIAEFFQKACEAVSVLVLPGAVVVAIYAKEILYLWTGDSSISAMAASVLSFLIIGNACNAVMNAPFALQLAFGWTRLALYANLLSIVILTPMTIWAVTVWGGVGGAATWFLLQVAVVIIVPSVMHARLLPSQKFIWYKNALLIPFVLPIVFAGSISFVEFDRQSTSEIILFVFMSWVAASSANALFLPHSRALAVRLVSKH